MGKDIIIGKETRSWKYPEEESHEAITFALKNKKNERFLLVKDKNVSGMWNIHFCCSSPKALSEEEKNLLVEAIIEYIKPGEYLGTCGCSTRGGEEGFKRFSYRSGSFFDTGCIRVLHDKLDGYPTYFPILKRI